MTVSGTWRRGHIKVHFYASILFTVSNDILMHWNAFFRLFFFFYRVT